VNAAYDYYAKTTYNPNNEPDLLAPYMYLYAGAPAKAATVVRAAYTLFTTGPDGMTGNDDLGEMSSWYVMSSLGVYPTMSGSGTFVLSTPQFPSTTVTIGRYGAQGGKLRITAPGVTDTARYITSARVNGLTTQRSWVRWSELRHGGSLAYTVSSAPSSFATRASDAPPAGDTTADDHRVALSASAPSAVAPTSAQTVVLTGSAVAQWPGSRPLTQRVIVPPKWKAAPAVAAQVVHSDGLPVGVDTPVTVRPPVGAAPGTYPVTFRFSAPGVPTLTRSVSVTLKDATCADATSGRCALVLEPDLDGTATTDAPSSGNFDGGGWSFDAALLPAAGPATLAGAPFVLPDPSGTSANFVTARGQQLAVPAGAYSTLHLLGAAHGGDVNSTATVTYTDGTTAEVSFALTDWAGSSGRNGNTVALAMAHRIKAGQGVDGPPVNLFAATAPLDPTRTVQSIRLPDSPNAEVYAATFTT
jgi:hypothetical protein